MLERLRQRAKQLEIELAAIGFAYADRRVPWPARALAVCVVAYALSPIDVIPDFIPILGYLDDLILVPAGIALVLRMIPEEVMLECRAAAAETVNAGRPWRWAAAGLIVLVWLMLAVFVSRLLLPGTAE